LRLGAGASNDCFLLRFENGSAVARSPRTSTNSSLSQEAWLLSWLPAGIAPTPYGLVESEGAEIGGLLEEWLKGKHLFHLDLRSARALGKRLSQLHALPLDGLAPDLEVVEWNTHLERFRSRWARASLCIPLPLRHRFGSGLEGMEMLGSKLAIQDAMVVVHGDLIPLNLLFSLDGDCRLLDWELARIDHPAWDVASILKAFHFNTGALEAFFHGYGTRIEPATLSFFTGLESLRVALWRMEAFYVRGEFQDVAEQFLCELDEEIQQVETVLSNL
jgi:aminoglycoside phosphotransferase (APT) family kinase protein